MSNLQDYVKLARIAEQAGRYEDMKDYIVHVATTLPEGASFIQLSVEERNMFSVAFKNLINSKRTSWRTIAVLEEKLQFQDQTQEEKDFFKELKDKLQSEMLSICNEAINVIEKYLLIDEATTDENVDDRIYYEKMEGDYYRYEAEFLDEKERHEAEQHSEDCYERAMKEAELHNVSPINSSLLGLYLNYSVFLFEITNKRELAFTIATKALDNATPLLEKADEKDIKDSYLIIQLIQDNLALWSSETQ